jgi:nitrate reductase delta subunit
VLAHLLSYPDAELAFAPGRTGHGAAPGASPLTSRLAELDTLLQRLARRDALDTEAEFVELFDRGRGTACTCSSTYTATAATAARPWWT